MAQGVALKGTETPEELGAIAARQYRMLAKKVGIPSLKERGITREQMTEKKVIDDIFLNQNAMNKFPSGKGITREDAKWMMTQIYDQY